MSKRREVSGNYRMMISAVTECPQCFGTGIAQTPWPNQNRVEISMSVCMCVRVVPVHTAEGSNVIVRGTDANPK